MSSALYRSEVMHQRFFPVAYRFTHRVFSLLVDVDSIATEAAQLRWLSFNKRGLISLHYRNHGARDGGAWRPWVENQLAEVGLEKPARIQLFCMPRVLGYTFNPLSVWYCYNATEQLIAAICEVSNTLGDHYHYLLHGNGAAISWPLRSQSDKLFYVSPFIDMQQRYHFTLDAPGDRISIRINEYSDDRLMLVATQKGSKEALTDRNLRAAFWRLPLMTLKVIVMIHWHALKIWLRGGRYYSKTTVTESKSSAWPVTTPKS